VVRLLERRIGSIAEPEGVRIKALDSVGPTTLAEAALRFRGPVDLCAWVDGQGR